MELDGSAASSAPRSKPEIPVPARSKGSSSSDRPLSDGLIRLIPLSLPIPMAESEPRTRSSSSSPESSKSLPIPLEPLAPEVTPKSEPSTFEPRAFSLVVRSKPLAPEGSASFRSSSPSSMSLPSPESFRSEEAASWFVGLPLPEFDRLTSLTPLSLRGSGISATSLGSASSPASRKSDPKATSDPIDSWSSPPAMSSRSSTTRSISSCLNFQLAPSRYPNICPLERISTNASVETPRIFAASSRDT